MSFPEYSVLMSVYSKEKPDRLEIAAYSMLRQTVPPSEFVIVEDGLLTDELFEVINKLKSSYPEIVKIVAYRENKGLGYALCAGVMACTKPIIARMDSDDWARPDRMEIQLAHMIDNKLDMISSQVIEFIDSPEKPLALTDLPEDNDSIIAYSKRRNPFRHPPMTFRREKVLEAGNYSPEFLYFEDWDLFNRMLAAGCRAENVHEPLVAMRVSSDFYSRRGGVSYLLHSLRFKSAQVSRGWFNIVDFALSFFPQAAVSILPNRIRTLIYTRLLRREPNV